MKTVLITGASRGIGRAIAKQFASSGYCVIANYNKSEDAAKSLLEEIQQNNGVAYIYKADVGNADEVKNLVDFAISKVGHIDVLINNAGISCKNLLIDEPDDSTNDLININLTSAINTCKHTIPNMLNNGFGRIINISSIWGVCGASCEATYSASKSGLIGLTKALAKEYGYNNITVNCICPGLIDTDMNKNLSQEELEDVISNIPAKRAGKVEDISNMVLFLSEKTGEYITGQIITIDGGFTL